MIKVNYWMFILLQLYHEKGENYPQPKKGLFALFNPIGQKKAANE
jgi:hypothetical protein